MRPGLCKVRTVSSSDREASKEDRGGREQHYFMCRRLSFRACGARCEVTILSRMFEMVWSRTIILNEAGEW